MRRIVRGIDQAKWLRNLLIWFRTHLPARRGLLLLGAIGLTLLSLIVHILYLASALNPWLGLCGFLVLHVALLLGFLGVLIAEALGRGFRE